MTARGELTGQQSWLQGTHTEDGNKVDEVTKHDLGILDNIHESQQTKQRAASQSEVRDTAFVCPGQESWCFAFLC